MARDSLSCRKFVDFLDQYIDKTLAPEVVAEVDRHFARCPACRDYMATYRDTIRISGSLCREDDDPVPADVPQELVEAILASWKKAEGGGGC